LALTGPGAVSFDRIRIGEDIAHGQQVEEFAVDVQGPDGDWQQAVATGTTIGYARILALPAPVTGTAVRVRVLQSRAPVRLAHVGVHRSVPAV
jgi:alpha-L-fucosidase